MEDPERGGAPGKRVGQHLGNYRLVSFLGQGGQAEVYLGKHLHLGTHAAIKVLHAAVSVGEEASFRQEAQLIAHLRHPNIVRVLDFSVQETVPFLVMDYAQGGTLRSCYPAGTRVALANVISYVTQAAGALQYPTGCATSCTGEAGKPQSPPGVRSFIKQCSHHVLT